MWEEEGDVKAIENLKDREMTRAGNLLDLTVGKLQLVAPDAVEGICASSLNSERIKQ